jgi:hypothetical protein
MGAQLSIIKLIRLPDALRKVFNNQIVRVVNHFKEAKILQNKGNEGRGIAPSKQESPESTFSESTISGVTN